MPQAHEDRNLARKLTPAEKKEKKLKKLVGEANEGDAPQVALYKVMDLSNRQHQFKVKMNAQVSHLYHSFAQHIMYAHNRRRSTTARMSLASEPMHRSLMSPKLCVPD